MSIEERILQFAQLVAISIIAVGCYLVLRPFISAMLFALVLCISTWPIYQYLLGKLRGKSTLAALLMVISLIVLVIVPASLLTVSLVNNVAALVETARTLLAHGPIKPPTWLVETPFIGNRLDLYWQSISSGGSEAMALLEPARNFLLNTGKEISQGFLQMVFALFVGFFFYRDGESLIQMLRYGLNKLAGHLGVELLTTIHHTVASVVQGVFGSALAQAIVATIGFMIAGVPGAFLLGAATFFVSLLPIGPPIFWIGASIWLFMQESYAWAIFMVLWGLFAISSIDNVVKPYLISRGSSLSLLVVTLGVFGGIASFGFIGIFIGPPILAVGITLVQLWTQQPKLEKVTSV